MKFFLDSTDIEEIRALAETGLIDGITTNPSLMSRVGGDMASVLREICAAVAGPVSAEVVATEIEGMVMEGRYLASLADNIVIKLPITMNGVRACRIFADEGLAVNMTLCFTEAQALLAAKAGARFVSPFIGRLDDIGLDGSDLIRAIRAIYDNYPAFETEILAASIRSVSHIALSAQYGADAVTVPPRVFRLMVSHPLTDKGLASFLSDWSKTGQKILPD